jgi:hypothetical protein
MNTLTELRKIIDQAEAYRKQAWLTLHLPSEVISFKVKDCDERDKLMHVCRRSGITASYATMCDSVKNIDIPNRKEPFWGTKFLKEEAK